MINPVVRQRILSLMGDISGREIWEVGPGLGAISRLILDKGANLTVFEIDRGFIEALEELFASEIAAGRFVIRGGDAQKQLFPLDAPPDLIVGNLPYNVGSAIIAKLMGSRAVFQPMVFTLQREVVQRICAQPGSKEYGSFSILCQYAMVAQNHGNIAASSFYPEPDVISAILRLAPMYSATDPAAPSPEELALADRSLRVMFASRRKTLSNNLKQLDSAAGMPARSAYLEAMEACGISGGMRAEEMSVPQFRALVSMLIQAKA